MLLAFLLLPVAALANEVRIAVGMSQEKAVGLIKDHSGVDITSGMEVLGPKGKWPLKGVYWRFRDYDAVITLSAEGGKIKSMTFWKKKDFDESKSHRATTEQTISALDLDTKTKDVSFEKAKQQKRSD